LELEEFWNYVSLGSLDLPSVVVAYFQDSALFKPVTLDLITRSKIVLVYLNGMFDTEI
jgi:hypothetical protein